MRLPFFILFCSILCSAVHKAEAAELSCSDAQMRQPMQASIHNHKGRKILLLAGEIEPDSGRRVAPYVSSSSSYQEVWMCSPGGAVHGGIEIGKVLNRAKATVRTPNGFSCISACTIAAMGGYARIIDPGASFIIHASSARSNFGFRLDTDAAGNKGLKVSSFQDIYCDKNWNTRFCSIIRAEITANDFSKHACSEPEMLRALDTTCSFFDTSGKNYRDDVIAANALFSRILSADPLLVSLTVTNEMRSDVESDYGEIRLLKYFQEMLLDGQTGLIDENAYRALRTNFVPRNIYEMPPSHQYARNLNSDMQLFEAAQEFKEAFAVWQAILTDAELSLKAQLSEYIRSNNVNLGAAADAALEVYDAMRVCQIQSLCKLERHRAEALGYHNLYDYQ